MEYVVPLAAPSPASDYVAAPDAGFVLVPNGGMTPGGFPPEMLGYPQPYVYPDPNVAFYEPYYQPPKPASKPSPCFNRTQKLVYILDVLALLTAISVLITLLGTSPSHFIAPAQSPPPSHRPIPQLLAPGGMRKLGEERGSNAGDWGAQCRKLLHSCFPPTPRAVPRGGGRVAEKLDIMGRFGTPSLDLLPESSHYTHRTC